MVCSGGWADVGYSASENAEKEVIEETGLQVKAIKLLALTDRTKHPHPPMFYMCIKLSSGVKLLMVN